MCTCRQAHRPKLHRGVLRAHRSATPRGCGKPATRRRLTPHGLGGAARVSALLNAAWLPPNPWNTTRIGGAMGTIAGENRAQTAEGAKGDLSRGILEWGGFAAGVVLITFGVVAIVMGFNGRSTVGDSLKQEKIVGTADMTPAAIKAEATKAGLDVNAIDMPTVAV